MFFTEIPKRRSSNTNLLPKHSKKITLLFFNKISGAWRTNIRPIGTTFGWPARKSTPYTTV
jgi:hypothetical protein